MMEQGYSLADIAAATGNSGGNNNDGFGGGNGWQKSANVKLRY